MSKQVELATLPLSPFFFAERSRLPELIFPAVSQSGEQRWVHRYYANTAVSWKHIETADSLPAERIPPIHKTFPLDAIQAFMERDYRRVLLYSAMAMETVAATKLDEAYDRLRQEGDSSGRFRLVSRVAEKGKLSTKDPIYDDIKKKGQDDFARVLDLRPLYLLGRSLLDENQVLYQKAMRLYRTRNKIVHLGEPPAEKKGDYFRMNVADALVAIDCAIEVSTRLLYFADTASPHIWRFKAEATAFSHIWRSNY